MRLASSAALLSLALAIASGCQDLTRGGACRQKLEAVGEAIVSYRFSKGRLPPIQYSDDAGNLLHTWRVLLVPYIEANAFYEEYDFYVAWNQGSNEDLMKGSRFIPGAKFPYPASVRGVFQCSLAPDRHETSFVAVVTGELVSTPRPLRPGTGQLAYHEDGSDVFRVVELSESGIHWMEPRDIYLLGSNRFGSLQFADRDATLAYFDDLIATANEMGRGKEKMADK